MNSNRNKLVLGLVLGAAGAVFLGACVFCSYWISTFYNTTKNGNEEGQPEISQFVVKGNVFLLEFSNDSKYLLGATSSADKWEGRQWAGEVHVWDIATKKEVHSEKFDLPVRSISFHPHEAKVVIATSMDIGGADAEKPGHVLVFEFPSFKVVNRLETRGAIGLMGVKYSPDGTSLAVHECDRGQAGPEKIVVVTVDDLKPIATITNLQNVRGFGYSPDSKYLLASTYDQPKSRPELTLFDAKTGDRNKSYDRVGQFNTFLFVKKRLWLSGCFLEPDLSLSYHSRPERSGAIPSYNGRFELATKPEGPKHRPNATEVILWDNEKDRVVHIPKKGVLLNRGPIYRAFSPDSKYFAVGRTAHREVKANEEPGPWLGDVLLFKVPD